LAGNQGIVSKEFRLPLLICVSTWHQKDHFETYPYQPFFPAISGPACITSPFAYTSFRSTKWWTAFEHLSILQGSLYSSCSVSSRHKG